MFQCEDILRADPDNPPQHRIGQRRLGEHNLAMAGELEEGVTRLFVSTHIRFQEHPQWGHASVARESGEDKLLVQGIGVARDQVRPARISGGKPIEQVAHRPDHMGLDRAQHCVCAEEGVAARLS